MLERFTDNLCCQIALAPKPEVSLIEAYIGGEWRQVAVCLDRLPEPLPGNPLMRSTPIGALFNAMPWMPDVGSL